MLDYKSVLRLYRRGILSWLKNRSVKQQFRRTGYPTLQKLLFLKSNWKCITLLSGSLTVSLTVHKASRPQIRHLPWKPFLTAGIFFCYCPVARALHQFPKEWTCRIFGFTQRVTIPSVHSTASFILPCSRGNKREHIVIHNLKKPSSKQKQTQHRTMQVNSDTLRTKQSFICIQLLAVG